MFSNIIVAQTQPDFSCVGFASLNGGTTGGEGGQEVTVVNLEQFKKYVSEKDATPRIIYVKGTLEGAGGGEIVAIGSNKSIIGIGQSGKVSKVQFYLKNSKNIIIKNVFFTMENSTLGGDADCISIATTGSAKCQNIWIDHCTFDNNLSPIANPSASVKDKYDGLLDIKKNSEYITISWCVFKNHYKGILVGYTATDTYDRKITMHHNSFINISSRTPSFRGGTAHIYNNYWEGSYDSSTHKYFSTGVNCRESACLYVESNYFKNMNKTVYCAIEDVTVEGYAFYQNNKFENSNSETVNTCNSFTPPYTVSIDDASDIPSIVTQYAGIGKVTDPENIPDPEDGPPSDDLDSPVLDEAINKTENGFDIAWTAVDEATEYIVTLSYQDENAENTIFSESFNNFTTSTVTKNGLTSGLTDNASSKYNVTGSGSKMLCSEDGTMDLNGGRFSILNLDLSSNPTLEILCKWVSGTKSFNVCIDYEGTSTSTAIYKVNANEIGSEYTTISIPLIGGTNNSFIQLRTESETVIRIDNISISNSGGGYKEESYTVTAPQTSYSFTGLDANKEYEVSVRAKQDDKISDYSNTIYVQLSLNSIENEFFGDNINVYYAKETIIVDNAHDKLPIRIYTIQGVLIGQSISSGNSTEIPVSLVKGIYLVQVGNKAFKLIVK